MKAKVFYQEFRKSLISLHMHAMFFEPECATFIQEVDFEDPGIQEWSKIMGITLDEQMSRSSFCEIVFSKMNHLDIPKWHPDRKKFEKAGHTSMSSGDFIEFEDGEIWMCRDIGWSKRRRKDEESPWVEDCNISYIS